MSERKPVLRVGTTEGRFRMIMPELIRQFSARRPDVRLEAKIGSAEVLTEQLSAGELDLAFSGISMLKSSHIAQELLLDERLFFVVSDHLLRQALGDRAEALQPELIRGADLSLFRSLPFCLSLPNLHCMQILHDLLESKGIRLDCIHTSAQFDLHQQLAQADYAACFCLSMYVPHLKRLNEGSANPLHLYPIQGLEETNPVYLITNRERGKEAGQDDFADVLRRACRPFEAPVFG